MGIPHGAPRGTGPIACTRRDVVVVLQRIMVAARPFDSLWFLFGSVGDERLAKTHVVADVLDGGLDGRFFRAGSVPFEHGANKINGTFPLPITGAVAGPPAWQFVTGQVDLQALGVVLGMRRTPAEDGVATCVFRGGVVA